jgi:hypothetical protein
MLTVFTVGCDYYPSQNTTYPPIDPMRYMISQSINDGYEEQALKQKNKLFIKITILYKVAHSNQKNINELE